MKLKSLLLASFILASSIILAQADRIYGLNFVGSELRFTTMDVNTGAVSILSQSPISPDIFQQGVSDFDPIGKRYLYPRGFNGQEQLYSIDALSGDILNNPGINIINPPASNNVASITNIAYNWLDNTLYGINHRYDGSEQLYLCKANIENGEVEIISPSAVSSESYLSGNSDIDPVNRRYFFANSNKIYTVDLDSGETLHEPNIQYPMSGVQFTANLTYDWQEDILYCLHFLSVPNPDPFSDSLTSELRLATLDPITGEMNLISQEITSNDGFSMGDCDIDPTGNRYFYIRQEHLYIVSLEDGTVLQTIPIDNQNNAVAPIINMAYDDLTANPEGPLLMDMGETASLDSGEPVTLNAWVGNDATYLWNDGFTDAIREVQTPGDYSVTITKDAFTIHGSIEVTASPVNVLELSNNRLFDLFPNPASEYIQIKLKDDNNTASDVLLYQSNGKLYRSFNMNQSVLDINISDVPQGIYMIQVITGDNAQLQKLLIE